MTHERRTFESEVDPNEILSAWHREILSSNATQLFTAVWYKARNSGQKTVWLGDAEASQRARILIQYIPGAQSEIARAGLMHLVPGENQTRYELITDETAQ
jgi:hypothetical protein